MQQIANAKRADGRAVRRSDGRAFGRSAAAQSVADKYPDKPIKIIVPFAPGGSTDIIARVVGQKMTEHWGQTVVVETRPGAATIIGTQAAAKADPDGYTLLLTVSNHATNPSLRDKMPYDALADFEFVSMVTRIPIIPYTNPKFEPTNLKELIADGKGQARHHQLRLGRRGQHDAPCCGNAEAAGRHRHDPRALSRRHAGDERRARGHDPDDVRHCGAGAAAVSGAG